MEIGLDAAIPTYAGGLGILAGDTIRSAADRGVPMVAVTLLHRKGYFHQELNEGSQKEHPEEWSIERSLVELPRRVSVTIEARTVRLRCWMYEVIGIRGHRVPVYFLGSDLPENEEWDRRLTHHLYGGDRRYRLCQEVILGIGGVRMLRALGHDYLERFHMNEGHSSLLTLALLEERMRSASRSKITMEDVDAVRRQCVFTTHTPVAAGHDDFEPELVEQVLDHELLSEVSRFSNINGKFNMTYLALNLSRYVNGVARRHGEVSRLMFGGYVIDSITNGVHAATWTSEPFQELFDRHMPGWREDNSSLRYAASIPNDEIWAAHQQAKRQLVKYIERSHDGRFDLETFTIGFARRATAYKRPDLLLRDPGRLDAMAESVGPLQVVYAGKAHPQDEAGKRLIQEIAGAREKLGEQVRLVYLENYDIGLGHVMTSGCDLWLNTPEPPLEASGTSGMKASLNGVPSLSILDGWWIEGHIEGVTGWSIGEDGWTRPQDQDRSKDVDHLYEKLGNVVLPLFYRNRDRYLDVMRYAISLNGSFFNSERMVAEYVRKAYQ